MLDKHYVFCHTYSGSHYAGLDKHQFGTGADFGADSGKY